MGARKTEKHLIDMQKHEKIEKVTGSRDDKGKGNGCTKSGCWTEALFRSKLDRSEVQPSLRNSMSRWFLKSSFVPPQKTNSRTAVVCVPAAW